MEIPIKTEIQTARCVLRYPQQSDAQAILGALRDPAFPPDLPLAQIQSLEGVEAWIDGTHERWATGQGYTWSVDHREQSQLVGQVTIVPHGNTTWALAFWTHPDFWGAGYATEASRAAIEFAFGRLRVGGIWAAAGTWNGASQRVLTKLGMTELGINPAGYTIGRRTIATVEYELTREAWLASQE